jgi:integrase
LGAIPLQRLRPAQIHDWHTLLLRKGGHRGRPLSTHTVAHAHRVLHRGLARAVQLELVARNVASAVSPPKLEAPEVMILTAEQMADMLARLDGHSLHPIIAFALGTGMRRGELCALAWGALDLDAKAVRVERSLEQTKAGLRVKSPKSRHGRRTISLPTNVVEIMREHRRRQLELRLAFGLGRLGADDLVFPHLEGGPYPPDSLSRAFSRLMVTRGLPPIHFHALRHSHASALIAAGLDVVSVSRRLGHGSAGITLTVYAHLFASKDTAAADAIDAAMRGGA